MIEYKMDSSHYHSTKFMRNSKAIGVLWGVFTVCCAIIIIVSFVQDQWIGDSQESKGPGNFGLYRWCSESQDGTEICQGRLDDFSSILSPAFRASTVFVGIAVVVILLCIVSLVLFLMCRSADVFKICGSMQFLAGLCLAVGILCYPAGWDHPEVRGICGSQAEDFKLGNCQVRWAYILAIISFFDCMILGILAFTLAGKKVKYIDESPYMSPTMYKGEINSAYIPDTQSLQGSRKSMNLQPVMLMPQGPGELDRYSEFSHRTARSNPSPFRGAPFTPTTHQPNFQL